MTEEETMRLFKQAMTTTGRRMSVEDTGIPVPTGLDYHAFRERRAGAMVAENRAWNRWMAAEMKMEKQNATA